MYTSTINACERIYQLFHISPPRAGESCLVARNSGTYNTESVFSGFMSIWYDTAESEFVLLGIYIYLAFYF